VVSIAAEAQAAMEEASAAGTEVPKRRASSARVAATPAEASHFANVPVGRSAAENGREHRAIGRRRCRFARTAIAREHPLRLGRGDVAEVAAGRRGDGRHGRGERELAQPTIPPPVGLVIAAADEPCQRIRRGVDRQRRPLLGRRERAVLDRHRKEIGDARTMEQRGRRRRSRSASGMVIAARGVRRLDHPARLVDVRAKHRRVRRQAGQIEPDHAFVRSTALRELENGLVQELVCGQCSRKQGYGE
jgi:hypothetical protein